MALKSLSVYCVCVFDCECRKWIINFATFAISFTENTKQTEDKTKIAIFFSFNLMRRWFVKISSGYELQSELRGKQNKKIMIYSDDLTLPMQFSKSH